MHPARAFHESDPAVLRQRILDHPFALVAAASEGRPLAVHAPVLPYGEGEALVLRFHLSVANPVTKALLAGSPALAVFTGAHSYISPDWYNLDHDQVPTWNYLSVEAEGPVTRLDPDATLQQVDNLSDFFESQLAPKPVWKTAKMTPARRDGLLRGIVAFELQPMRFEGITKLSQNKPAEARAGVIAALDATESGFALAAEMRKLES
ncbi:MAG TPA: FMN-binding negative transcriptional regulator [Hyphomonas sp.]|nr:FMN-binding negative transcriptional regulator [Hyphomonas sp.]